jgi:predicted nucleotidyltransferase
MKLSADPSYFFIGSNVTLLLLYLYLRYVHSEITSDRTEAMNLEQLRTYKPQILAIAGEHGVGNVRVFGSVVRGEADGQSDVDFLVSLERLTGWKFFGLWEELEKLLGCEVDIVTDEAINRHIRDRILNEAVPL